MAKKKNMQNAPVGSTINTPDGATATVVEVDETPVAPVVETPVAVETATPVIETPVIETVAPVIETPATPTVAAAPAGNVISFPGGSRTLASSSRNIGRRGRGPSSWKFLTAGILAQHMETKGLSAAKVAEALGSTAVPIYSWKNGKTCPSVAMEIKLAQFLNIPVPEHVLELQKKRPAASKKSEKAQEEERIAYEREREKAANEKALELLKQWLATPNVQAGPESVGQFLTATKKALLGQS